MNGIMTTVVAIIEHAIERGELPADVSKSQAEYVAQIARMGAQSTAERETEVRVC